RAGAASSATSSARATTSRPRRVAASSPRRASRLPSTTRIPRAASTWQTSSPIPRFPPVTSATRMKGPPLLERYSIRDAALGEADDVRVAALLEQGARLVEVARPLARVVRIGTHHRRHAEARTGAQELGVRVELRDRLAQPRG